MIFPSAARDILARAFVTSERRVRRPIERAAFTTLGRLHRASADDVYAAQKARLASVIASAARTPYYRTLFARKGMNSQNVTSFDDLKEVPILTKQDLQDHLSELLDPDVPVQDRIPNQSGGSTGAPTLFYQERHFWAWQQAVQWLTESWCGYQPGDRLAYLWGSDRDAPRRHWRWGVRQFLENTHFENAFQMTPARLDQFIALLETWKAPFLWSYVSSAVFLARYVRQKGRTLSFRAIRTTAESLTPADRMILHETFGGDVFDQYGSREMGILAHECAAHAGLHVMSPLHWIEVLPIEGSSLGRIVVTNLTNRAMPLLRYETGDLARWSTHACACGCRWPVLEAIAGRQTDILVSPSGKWIHGEFFTHLFYPLEGIRQFQVIQLTRSDLQIRIAFVDGNPSRWEPCVSYLEKEIHARADPAFRLRFERVDSIAPSASGKFRFTESRVPALSS
jgi:phenylacetate-CoA ligase